MLQMFDMMARYNRWANERLYSATEPLSDSDYRADQGAFFKSLHGTLNHLLVADRIWMHRFTGQGVPPKRLDVILHEDFPALSAARAEEDVRIIGYVSGLDDAALAGTFTYRTVTNPTEITQPLAPALMHFFNHQTHHRGQAHALLTRSAGDAPSFDLIAFQRETGIGLS